MSDDVRDIESKEVEGFPAVPVFVRADAAGKEPSRAVDRCLEQLDGPALRKFGAEAIQVTALAAVDMRAALAPLGQGIEVESLDRFAKALEGFSVAEDAGRRRRSPVEWLRRQAAPVDTFLAQLEALAQAVPDLSGQTVPGWGFLSATYGRAHSALSELGAYVQAGEIRMAELTAQIEAKRGVAANGCTPDRGGDDASDLSRRRDAVERRTHLLRIVLGRVGDYLEEVRHAARLRERLSEAVRGLDRREVPKWEAVLIAVTETIEHSAGGRAPVDISPVLEANATLLEAVREVLKKAAELRTACGAAQLADPGAIDQIEGRVMGPQEDLGQ